MSAQSDAAQSGRSRLILARLLSIVMQLLCVGWMVTVFVAGDAYGDLFNYVLLGVLALDLLVMVPLMRKLGATFSIETRTMKALDWVIMALSVVFTILRPSYFWSVGAPLILLVVLRLYRRRKLQSTAGSNSSAEPAGKPELG